MKQYFDRVCAIDISPDIRVDNHKIRFEIKKSIAADKNYCRVDIYNLGENTRNKITNDINSLVKVQAGYSYNTNLVEIGQGNISNVFHRFSRPDIITTIYSKDGFNATRDTIVSLSFGENTPLRAIINAIIEKLGLPVKFTDYDKSAVLQNGYSFIGTIPNALNELAQKFNFRWSIQNGQIQILSNDKGTNRQTVFLSANTGLIDNPEKVIETKLVGKMQGNEYRVTALMQPQVEVGDLIKVESRIIEGNYIINELEHIGDTRGNEWFTIMTVVENG